MKKYTIFLALSLLFFTDFVSAQEVNWVTIEKADSLQKKYPNKPILVDFYTDWCGWCKRMEQTTFKDPELVKYLNNDFIATRFNAESEKEINFRGKVYKFYSEDNKRGVHLFAYYTLKGKLGYPSFAIIDKSGVKKVISGYSAAPKFLADLKAK